MKSYTCLKLGGGFLGVQRLPHHHCTLSQNVLAACNFDMQFVFVLPGWEDSAHDRRVLSDAQSRHGFNTPKGKYWLGDASYGNSEYVMAPYRGVRYYLKEQRQAYLRYV